MKIAIGSDHAGFGLKEVIKKHLEELGYEYKDFGTFDESSVDYPDYAFYVGKAVQSGEYERGILVCGTGIGMSITANKISGIRCALCHDVFSAKATRQHNDSNVLAMGARVIGNTLALKVLDAWLEAEFEGGRHARRVDKISNIEDTMAVERAEQLSHLIQRDQD
ncbi:MAG: ribose 5-phosphate isomerase B [Bacillota bacterium]|jgi:ribose 5-phosphate isomerase B